MPTYVFRTTNGYECIRTTTEDDAIADASSWNNVMGPRYGATMRLYRLDGDREVEVALPKPLVWVGKTLNRFGDCRATW